MQTSDELLFADSLKKLEPILQVLITLTNAGHISMTNQKFRMDANHQTIVLQEKTISENKVLIDEASKKATSIISMAEDRSKEVENNMKNRVAQINHMEREAKEKLAKAEKILWEAEDKKKVKV